MSAEKLVLAKALWAEGKSLGEVATAVAVTTDDLHPLIGGQAAADRLKASIAWKAAHPVSN